MKCNWERGPSLRCTVVEELGLGGDRNRIPNPEPDHFGEKRGAKDPERRTDLGRPSIQPGPAPSCVPKIRVDT